MTSQMLRRALCSVFVSFAVAASSQESKPDPSAAVDNSSQAGVDECFAVPSVVDMNVISDQHVYIRTRGGNHYLLTTERACEGLERSNLYGDAFFVPYGRRVCQHDGSYILYETGGRELTCPVLRIERVDDRAQAHVLADGIGVEVEVEVEVDVEVEEKTLLAE